MIDATVIWDLEDDPEERSTPGRTRHHGGGGRRGSQRPPEPNGSEPTNGPAAGFRLDFDRQVYHGHLGRGIGRPPDHLSCHSLRSPPAPREEAMSQTDSKPALSRSSRPPWRRFAPDRKSSAPARTS